MGRRMRRLQIRSRHMKNPCAAGDLGRRSAVRLGADRHRVHLCSRHRDLLLVPHRLHAAVAHPVAQQKQKARRKRQKRNANIAKRLDARHPILTCRRANAIGTKSFRDGGRNGFVPNSKLGISRGTVSMRRATYLAMQVDGVWVWMMRKAVIGQ